MLVCLCLLASSAEALPRLHAERGEAPRIEDSRGRQVLLRGVNVNQLGDYYRANSAFETVIPLRRADFRRIARVGFNSVRLLVSWSKLEPQPGEFNRAYVRRIARAVSWAREQRLYVILDMHQDAWGKFIDTEEGETCLPGFTPAVGWDGAPEWATLTNGLPTCKASMRELSPAVGAAWQNFYMNTNGIQDALAETWGRLARRFAADPTIAGYDLLNEPNPGLLPGVNDGVPLGDYYANALAEIREAEASRRGGFEHVAFFEPGIVWSATAFDVTPPPVFTDDENIVFAPHLYSESISPTATIEQGFDLAEASASTYGTTVWAGEWGFFGEPDDNKSLLARYAAAEDEHVYGGAWWSWKQACGDPHVISAPGGQPNPISPSLNRYACPSGENTGIPRSTRRILGRATVRHAPGLITSLKSDPATREFRIAGSASQGTSCRIVAWVPGPAKPRFRRTNVSRVRTRRVPGGYIVRGCARNDYKLTKRVRPSS